MWCKLSNCRQHFFSILQMKMRMWMRMIIIPEWQSEIKAIYCEIYLFWNNRSNHALQLKCKETHKCIVKMEVVCGVGVSRFYCRIPVACTLCLVKFGIFARIMKLKWINEHYNIVLNCFATLKLKKEQRERGEKTPLPFHILFDFWISY